MATVTGRAFSVIQGKHKGFFHMATVDSLQKKRTLLITSARQIIDGLEGTEVNCDELKAKSTVLQDLLTTIEDLNEKILDGLLETADEETLRIEMQLATTEKTRIIQARIAIDRSVKEDTSSSKTTQSSFKLPRISLEKYDLSPANYVTWWTQFRTIDEAEDLEDTIKFQYLKNTLTGNSRALIDTYPNLKENYSKALDHLKNRFGRKELIVNQLYRELFNLVMERPSLLKLYDVVHAKIRSLESIGVPSGNADMLVPMLEECMPTEVRKRWERDTLSGAAQNLKMESLLEFLHIEAVCEERAIGMPETDMEGKSTTSALVNTNASSRDKANQIGKVSSKVNLDKTCLFCKETHASKICKREMSVEKRREIVKERKACFACLRIGHSIGRCRLKVYCALCKGRHYSIVCLKGKPEISANLLSSQIQSETVVLKTLVSLVKFNGKAVVVRILLDSASHRSYISSRVCEQLGLISKENESLRHMLFGGVVSEQVRHAVHEVELQSLINEDVFRFKALRQEKICGSIPQVRCKELLRKVAEKNVVLAEDDVVRPIDILIGADYMGLLLTGTMKCIDKGLMAFETKLGWCLLGSTTVEEMQPCMLNVVSTLMALPKLWDLDVLGIESPKNISVTTELEENSIRHFCDNVVFTEGKYKVALPWIEDHPMLPTNRELALNRLDQTLCRLQRDGLYDEYDKVLQQWEQEKFIEIVTAEDENEGHYLPHRPILREEKTTKIRPVFDASAKRTGSVSLNECLARGPNLITEIPSLLMRFRNDAIGVTADIKQAFLKVGLKLDRDKNMLKFLWQRKGQLIVFRHCSVVFGLTSSPFLLNAVIRRHLTRYSDPAIQQISQSFYVDDCVFSVADLEQGKRYKERACEVLQEANFELRGWVFSGDNVNSQTVLGSRWLPQFDLFGCPKPRIAKISEWTKKDLLSVVGRFYDPLGLLAAPLLKLKLTLQECFKLKLSWNEPLPKTIENRVKEWVTEVDLVDSILIDRKLKKTNSSDLQLHVFSDASKNGMGVCVFLRAAHEGKTEISFVLAKSRVCPLELLTIPRLELVAAGLAARLGSNVSTVLKIDDVTYWSDSMVVLCWISKGEWKTFVGNRVKEIRKLTRPEQWRFVEGSKNPADLISRGCTLREYLYSDWLKGPSWLRDSKNSWPSADIIPTKEALIEQKIVSLVNVTDKMVPDDKLFSYFSSFKSNVKVMAWILRFVNNARKRKLIRGGLHIEEINAAEKRLYKWMQHAWKPSSEHLELYMDEEGVLRVHTKVLSDQFEISFRSPIVLIACPLVERLIEERHKELFHAGPGWVINSLRDKVWIVNGRRTARKVISKCVTCRRFRGKTLVAPPIGLPDRRVNLGKVFEIVGCDLLGPLYLKNNSKIWIALFTCAVYRAVHLEIVESLSTDEFVLALRRMVARRGRISVMYTDNGTNFTGTWNSIKKHAVEPLRIKWIFNAPTASWWGGFFERLVGLVKILLKSVLGRACLNLRELSTLVVEVEAVINTRPITYVSNDCNDPLPITPAMFLQQEGLETEQPELDLVDRVSLNRRLRYIVGLRDSLKTRFCNEYLGALVIRKNRMNIEEIAKVGQVVLISSDLHKRGEWELGKIVEILPSRDEFPRVAKLRTNKGFILRPIQRLIPLEGFSKTNDNVEEHIEGTKVNTDSHASEQLENSARDQGAKTVKDEKQKRLNCTRSGRTVRVPARYAD